MALLILGLLLFLGVHSVRIVADGWRSAQLAQRGEGVWKGLYTVAALAGLALIIWGYGQARQAPVVLWAALPWARHLAALLMLLAFVLLAAAYVPRNAIKARLHHPMVLATKTWAVAHLLANNTLADVLLFGSFLLWAAFSFRAARQRDRVAGTVYPPGTLAGTVMALLAGGLAYALFVLWAHQALFGVTPM